MSTRIYNSDPRSRKLTKRALRAFEKQSVRVLTGKVSDDEHYDDWSVHASVDALRRQMRKSRSPRCEIINLFDPTLRPVRPSIREAA